MGCCCSAKVQDVGPLADVECLQRTPAEVKAVSDVLTRAFAGTASAEPELGFDWCLGPDLQGKAWDDPKRHDSMGWIFKFMTESVFASGSKGAVLVCRTADGAIGGVALLRIYRSKPSDGVCTMLTAGTRAGSESPAANKYRCGPRMAGFEAVLKKLHTAHGSGPHLFVYAVGIEPSLQGQGLGGKLMRAAAEVADREGLACYLECCGERCPKIYEKYGFAEAGQEELTTKSGEAFEHKYVAMVRPAKPKA